MSAPRYAAVAELRDRIGVSSTRDDPKLAAAIQAAEAQIDRYTGRNFDLNDTDNATRSFRPRSAHYCEIDDAIGVAGVEYSTSGAAGTFTAYTLTDLVLLTAQLGGSVERLEHDMGTFPVGRGCWIRVTPTGGWGWADVPAEVHEATLLQAAKLVKRADAPEGLLGFDGTGVAVLTPVAMDPDAVSLLAGLCRLSKWAP